MGEDSNAAVFVTDAFGRRIAELKSPSTVGEPTPGQDIPTFRLGGTFTPPTVTTDSLLPLPWAKSVSRKRAKKVLMSIGFERNKAEYFLTHKLPEIDTTDKLITLMVAAAAWLDNHREDRNVPRAKERFGVHSRDETERGGADGEMQVMRRNH